MCAAKPKAKKARAKDIEVAKKDAEQAALSS
jgi:hypothetical protein